MTRSWGREGIANRILLSLPRETFEKLAPRLELRNTTIGEIIYRADQPIGQIYFINRGLISLVKTMRDGRTVDVGAVGVEGITPRFALFGSRIAIVDTVVQIPGTLLGISRKALLEHLVEDPASREPFDNYRQFALKQLMQTAACNRLHSLEERCCRELLLAHDSALSETFPLTQEFLAMILGAQRSGVSMVASSLQERGLVKYSRGVVMIMNRAGLKEATCECYGEIRTEFEKLFSGSPSQLTVN